MSLNLSIKNVPDDLVAELRQRAQRNHRSLQGELMAIIEEAARLPAKPLSIQEVLARARRLGLPAVDEAAELVRADRDRRYRDASR